MYEIPKLTKKDSECLPHKPANADWKCPEQKFTQRPNNRRENAVNEIEDRHNRCGVFVQVCYLKGMRLDWDSKLIETCPDNHLEKLLLHHQIDNSKAEFHSGGK